MITMSVADRRAADRKEQTRTGSLYVITSRTQLTRESRYRADRHTFQTEVVKHWWHTRITSLELSKTLRMKSREGWNTSRSLVVSHRSHICTMSRDVEFV